MARMMEAVRDYGPKLELNPTAHLEQVADWMAMRTGLNTSEVVMVLHEINEAILFFNGQGTFKINLRSMSVTRIRANMAAYIR